MFLSSSSGVRELERGKLARKKILAKKWNSGSKKKPD
jgi:hypothetical protein